jgi:hypothetical protein
MPANWVFHAPWDYGKPACILQSERRIMLGAVKLLNFSKHRHDLTCIATTPQRPFGAQCVWLCPDLAT